MRKVYLFLSLIFLGISAFAQQWEQKASLPAGTNRHHPVNFVIDYKAYYATGVTPGNAILRDCYEYDPMADTWTKKADFPGSPRGFAYGVSYNGKGYLGFGVNATSYLKDFWEYDAANDSWKVLTSLPGPARKHPAMIALKGKIMVGLGDGPGGNYNDWWVYDIGTNAWTQAPDLPGVPRHHPFFFGIGDYAYAGFGHGASIYKDFYQYDVDNNTWTKLNDFPGESRVAGTQTSYNGKGYILGGDGSDHQNLDEGEFYEYDPTNDSWTALPFYPGQGRWAPGSFVIANHVYLTSGEVGSNQLFNDLWMFPLTPATGIETNSTEISVFNVSPNPVIDNIQLPSNLLNQGRLTVAIHTMSGQEVHATISENGLINTEHLSPQLYVLLVKDENGNQYSSKFLKN